MVVATFLSLPCLSSRLHRVVWYKLYHLKDARASGNLRMYREMCRNLMPTCDHMRSCNFQTPEIRSSSICMLSRPKNWLFSRHLKVLTWMFRLECSNLNVPCLKFENCQACRSTRLALQVTWNSNLRHCCVQIVADVCTFSQSEVGRWSFLVRTRNWMRRQANRGTQQLQTWNF